MLDMNFDPTCVGYGYAFDPGSAVLVPPSDEDGGDFRGGCVGLESLILP